MSYKNKTKIVATLGPNSDCRERIEELIKAGVSMFRLNTSHGKLEVHKECVKNIREIAQKLNKYVPILVDLQGPKIRVGTLIEPVELIDGEMITIGYGVEQTDKEIIPVDYKGIINDVKPGEKVLLDDGKLELKILSVQNDLIRAIVVHGGILKSRKGLNLPGTTTGISAVTDRDAEFIEFAVENNVDYIALSFVRCKEDLFLAKHYIQKYSGDIPIIAKIEKPQALDNIDDIIEEADGIMVARGDLGIELSPDKVPIVQKQLIEKANEARKVVIVATQMLESMIEQAIPTRAEASDVANAIIDGADAVMLSGETAVGKYPVEAVSIMGMIAKNIENSAFCPTNIGLRCNEHFRADSQAIVAAAMKMIEDLKVSAIVAFTKNGYTSKLLSKQRPNIPVICITDNEKTCNRLSLYWGLFPHQLDCDGYINIDILKKIDDMLMNETFLKLGDKVILTGSIPHLISGSTNFIRIHIVGQSLEDGV